MSERRSWYTINRSNPDVAEILLHDEIGLFGVTSKDFVADLQGVRAGAIKLHVNSPGGSVDDGIAIYNALMSHPAAVEVYVDALAASIATVIAMAGDRRVMAPHSRMMIHEAMALGMGFAADFEKMAGRLRDVTQNIAAVYAERTGKEAAYWLPLMAEETWFSDQQAVDEGLATEIGRDYVAENFQRARSFALLNKYQHQPEFDVVETTDEQAVTRELNGGHHGRLVALREHFNRELDALLSEIGPEQAVEEAEQAPEGDPEPSLSRIEARRKRVDEILAGLAGRGG